MQRRRSSRCVARDAGYAIEVGVMACQLGQTVGLHNRNEESIIRKQSGLLANQGAFCNQRRCDGQNIYPEVRHLFYGLAELSKLLHAGGRAAASGVARLSTSSRKEHRLQGS